MKNIHLIPTDKPSILFIDEDDTKLRLYKEPMVSVYATNQNLHITNSEEIKEGDWIFSTKTNNLFKADSIEYLESHNMIEDFDKSFYINSKYAKKIILTTDQSLDSVQAIDDEFLEWFIKNPSCEEIDVKYKYWKEINDIGKYTYKIIIPKEETKQEIVGYRLKPSIDRRMIDAILKNSMPIWNDEDKSVYFIRGHVAGSLVARMKELQVLDLWFTPIYEFEEVKSDWIKQNHLDYYYKEGIMSNKPKQETLEEAAKGYSERHQDVSGNLGKYLVSAVFKDGAKWQINKQERMYSEEESYTIWKAGQEYWKTSGESKTFEEFIEQFKKK